MSEETKLILAIDHIDALTSLLSGNEYQKFFYSQLLPVFYELKRQLTISQNTDKVKES
jgi:hypothetical protein